MSKFISLPTKLLRLEHVSYSIQDCKTYLPETFSINKQQYMYNIHSIVLSEKYKAHSDAKIWKTQKNVQILTIRITNVDNLYRVSFR